MSTSSQTHRPDDAATMNAAYRRLAEFDPPAMRALAAELERVAQESSREAALRPAAATDALAGRNARRARAAWAALAALDPHD
jgi:hypothetical protein